MKAHMLMAILIRTTGTNIIVVEMELVVCFLLAGYIALE